MAGLGVAHDLTGWSGHPQKPKTFYLFIFLFLAERPAWVAVARGWGEREDGDGRRDLGISILGEIWIVPFLERTWVRLKKEKDNVGLPETLRERERECVSMVAWLDSR
jgi:hypothetical protein